MTYKQIKLHALFIILLSGLILPAFFAIAPVTGGYTSLAADEDPKTAAEIQGVAGGGFEVTEYDLNAVINKNHSYDIVEKITVRIPDQLQRIDFSLPSGNFRITGIEVEDIANRSEKSDDSSTVSILEPDALVQGVHTYTIRYRINEFADRNENSDMFYFKVLPPDWKQPIARLSVTAEFPDDFEWGDMQCYAGQFGVQDKTNKISFEPDEAGRTVKITGTKIPENFGITLKAQLHDGYWEGALDGIWAVYGMMIVMGAAALILLILWLIGGRDPRVKRETETRPIEGVEPYEVGYVFNSDVSIRDIVMLLIDLAIGGYLRISEYEPKRYKLYRVKEPQSESKHVRTAYSILFEGIYKGRPLEMDQLGIRLSRIKSTITEDIAAGFADRDKLAFTPLSRAFRIAGIILTGISLGITNALSYLYGYLPVDYVESIVIAVLTMIVMYALCRAIDLRDSSSFRVDRLAEMVLIFIMLLIIAFVSVGIARSTGQIVAAITVPLLAVVCGFLVVIMRARGRENATLVTRFRQLRNFIYHPTPKELLDNYLTYDNYYYEMLPYALTFGAEESWAISFLTLDVPEPDWYSDDIEGHAFSNIREELTLIDYARDIRSFMRTIENAYNDMNRRSARTKLQ